MFGIDISQHNGSIDWDALKNSVDFVILRVGWTGNKNNHTIDRKFEQYYAEAVRVGIPVGVYVYLYNNNENSAIDGAEWTVKHLQGKTIQMPVYADMEDSSIADLGKATLTSITKAFNDVIEANGYKAGVYANLNWFRNYLDQSIQSRYTCWIAHYTSGDGKYKGEFDMWQNSSNGNINGVSGRVDTNYLYNESLISGDSHDDVPKGEFNMAIRYQNGSTPETVYADTSCTKVVGSLDRREQCDCLQKVNGMYLVLYKVNGTNEYKTGFVKYAGGVD